MNAQHPIRNPRVLLSVSMLLCAALVFGCQDTETPVGPELDTSAVSETAGVTFAGAKPVCDPPNTDPPHPSCNDDGDSGNGFTVVMEGGLMTALNDDEEPIPIPQVLDTFKENKRQISGKIEVFEVKLNLTATQAHAMTGNPNALPDGCSFTCDDAAFPNPEDHPCDGVFGTLANEFVSNVQREHPGLNIGFDKNAVNGEALSGTNCHFTGIANIAPDPLGVVILGVVIRNCLVGGNIETKEYIVKADDANRVEAGRRFETDGNPGLGPQDYRASLSCPLLDVFTVTFAAAE